MREKGVKRQKPSKTKIKISASLDPEALERIDRLAEDGGKSRSLVMAEIVGVGLPILKEKRRKNQRESPPG